MCSDCVLVIESLQRLSTSSAGATFSVDWQDNWRTQPRHTGSAGVSCLCRFCVRRSCRRCRHIRSGSFALFAVSRFCARETILFSPSGIDESLMFAYRCCRSAHFKVPMPQSLSRNTKEAGKCAQQPLQAGTFRQLSSNLFKAGTPSWS